jgi:hypothetical protein
MTVGQLLARQFLAQAAKGNAKAFSGAMRLVETLRPTEEDLAIQEEKKKILLDIMNSL